MDKDIGRGWSNMKKNMEIEREKPLPPNLCRKEDGWYWYDEGGEEFGPYTEAIEVLSDYSRLLDELLYQMFTEMGRNGPKEDV
jgi:hypothetical protein